MKGDAGDAGNAGGTHNAHDGDPAWWDATLRDLMPDDVVFMSGVRIGVGFEVESGGETGVVVFGFDGIEGAGAGELKRLCRALDQAKLHLRARLEAFEIGAN